MVLLFLISFSNDIATFSNLFLTNNTASIFQMNQVSNFCDSNETATNNATKRSHIGPMRRSVILKLSQLTFTGSKSMV